MKVTAITLFAGLAAALPQGRTGAGGTGASTDIGFEGKGVPQGSNMVATMAALMDKTGHLDGGYAPKVRNDLTSSAPCGKISFIFARASMEPDNMVCLMLPVRTSRSSNTHI